MALPSVLQASETMGASPPAGAATCALGPSSRRSHSETVPFSPAVQTTEPDASKALAHVMFPCAVLMVFCGPWLSRRGSKSESFWSEEMAASPPATGMISRT